MTTRKSEKQQKPAAKRKRDNGVHTRVIQAMVTPETAQKFHVAKSLRGYRGTREYLEFLISQDIEKLKNKEVFPGASGG